MKTGTWKVNFKIELDGIEVDFDELPADIKAGILALVKGGTTEGGFYIPTLDDMKKSGCWHD